MKCRLTVLLIVLLTTVVSLSSAQRITGGFKGGMNLANFHGDDVEDTKSKLGFCGGGFVTFSLSKVVVIQPELLYSQKGAKWEIEFLNETWKVTDKFNYLEIPIFIKMIMPVQGKVAPTLFLGPYFGITITNPREEIEVNGMTIEDEIEEVKDTDFGAVLGVGIDFDLGKGKIALDARYSLGLTTLSEADLHVKNNVFSFLLGYSF